MRGLVEVAESLHERGGRLLAVSADSPEQSRALRAELELPYTQLADPRGEIVRAYGLAHEEGGPGGTTIAVPALFLLRPDGTLAWKHVARRITDRADPEVALRAIESL